MGKKMNKGMRERNGGKNNKEMKKGGNKERKVLLPIRYTLICCYFHILQ
jgi:hypothetical protein